MKEDFANVKVGDLGPVWPVLIFLNKNNNFQILILYQILIIDKRYS